MVSACLEAFKLPETNFGKEARRAFEWFLGRNDLNLSVYDPTTGGCRDGLHSDKSERESRFRINFSFSTIIVGAAFG